MYFNIKYYNKWWYKVLTSIVILAVILTITFVPVQRAKAVGVLTATMGAAILAVLAGAGVYTVVSGMTWNDIQTWLTGRLNAWDTYRNDGQTWDQIFNPMENKVGATVAGFLKVEYELASQICQFVSWLINNDTGITDNDTVEVVQSSFVLNGQTVYKGPYIYNESQYVNFQIEASNYNYIYRDSTDTVVVFNSQGINERVRFVINNIITSGLSTFYINTSSNKNGYKYGTTTGVTSAQLDYVGIVKGTITVNEMLGTSGAITQTGSLTLDSDVIGIPDVETDQSDIIINPGAYPGVTTDEITDIIIDGILDNTLDTTITVTNEYVDSQAVVITNTLPISVDTDHHLFGFQLPSFNFNFATIWHYVTDAIEYSASWIAWFIAMITAVPVLAIPLYMSFTLIVIICFIKRVIL